MSSFVVEKETIDRVVWAIKYASTVSFSSQYEIDDLDRLGSRLWDLNERAVACRYRLEARGNRPYTYGGSLIYTNKSLRDLTQAFKSVECFLYQCSEGEEFENDPYFKLVQKVRSILADDIIEELPEYKEAKWG